MSRRLPILVAAVLVLAGTACGGASGPEEETDPVVLAAGDVADCGSPGDEATAKLLDGRDGTVVVLGDSAYETGREAEFEHCYAPTWGRHKARTRAVPGNHEYGSEGASGYYGYFGAPAGDPAAGYYSFDLAPWHVVALNSNLSCSVVACDAGSAQERWLREDLAASGADCTLALIHHPLVSAVKPEPATRPLWDALHEHGVDVVLAGHAHNYQRFAPIAPSGEADPERGIRQFVVGTGGRELDAIAAPAPHTEAWNDDTWGVLELTLRPGAYGWRFLPVEGKTFTDEGEDECR